MTNAVIPSSDAVRSQCPHCQAELSPSEIGKLYAGLRKNRRGGRPWPKKDPIATTTRGGVTVVDTEVLLQKQSVRDAIKSLSGKADSKQP